MKEPGLDNRHRDEDGEISRKHGNTLVRTLRKIYESGFAPGFKDDDKLSDVLKKSHEPTLTQLRRDHDMDSLEQNSPATRDSTMLNSLHKAPKYMLFRGSEKSRLGL